MSGRELSRFWNFGQIEVEEQMLVVEAETEEISGATGMNNFVSMGDSSRQQSAKFSCLFL